MAAVVSLQSAATKYILMLSHLTVLVAVYSDSLQLSVAVLLLMLVLVITTIACSK